MTAACGHGEAVLTVTDPGAQYLLVTQCEMLLCQGSPGALHPILHRSFAGRAHGSTLISF